MSFHIEVIVRCLFCNTKLGSVSVSRYTEDYLPVEIKIEPCGVCPPKPKTADKNNSDNLTLEKICPRCGGELSCTSKAEYCLSCKGLWNVMPGKFSAGT